MLINSFECLKGQGIKTCANYKLSWPRATVAHYEDGLSQTVEIKELCNSTGHQQKRSVIKKESVLRSQHKRGEFRNEHVKVLSQICCYVYTPQAFLTGYTEILDLC